MKTAYLSAVVLRAALGLFFIGFFVYLMVVAHIL